MDQDDGADGPGSANDAATTTTAAVKKSRSRRGTAAPVKAAAKPARAPQQPASVPVKTVAKPGRAPRQRASVPVKTTVKSSRAPRQEKPSPVKAATKSAATKTKAPQRDTPAAKVVAKKSAPLGRKASPAAKAIAKTRRTPKPGTVPATQAAPKPSRAPRRATAATTQPAASSEDRPQRRDAAINRDRVLVAAAAAIKREGVQVTSATIAEAAGVGVGTFYRHFPTRENLVAALAARSYRMLLEVARRASESIEPAIESLGQFLEWTIQVRAQLVLPLLGGPLALDNLNVGLRAELGNTLEDILARGRRDGTVRPDVTSIDVIIMSSFLAHPLPGAPDWESTARRQAAIMVDGLSTVGADHELPGQDLSMAEMETILVRSHIPDQPPAGTRPPRGRPPELGRR